MEKNDNLKKGNGFDVNPQNINRKGAPKTKLLKDVLTEDLQTESGGIDKLTAIINKLTTMAVKGDLNAIKEVLDRYAGKSQPPPTEIKLTTENIPPPIWKVIDGEKDSDE